MDEDAQHLAAELLVEGEAVAEGEGKRQHVLAYRSLGQDAVDQVRGGVGHAAGPAGRAEASLLAGIGHQPLAPALPAADAQKAVGEDSTSEKGAELPLDEAGDHAAPIAGGGEKALEVMLQGTVEHGGLGCAPLVLGPIGRFVTDESGIRHQQQLMRAACLRREGSSGREKLAAGLRVIVRSRGGRDGAFTGCRSLAHPGRVRCKFAHPVFPLTVSPCRSILRREAIRPSRAPKAISRPACVSAWRVAFAGSATAPSATASAPTPRAPRRGPRQRAEAGPELLDGEGRALFDALRHHRLALARREGVPPYVIASDRTLREFALLRPRNLQELELAHGIGPAKREEYGADLLAVVSGEGAN